MENGEPTKTQTAIKKAACFTHIFTVHVTVLTYMSIVSAVAVADPEEVQENRLNPLAPPPPPFLISYEMK